MIRTLKDIIRREGVLEAGYWSDALPLALASMRMTSAASHGLPPFTVVTGQYPSLPSHLLDDAKLSIEGGATFKPTEA